MKRKNASRLPSRSSQNLFSTKGSSLFSDQKTRIFPKIHEILMLWEYFTAMGCGYICHMAGSGCMFAMWRLFCLLWCKRVCHKVNVFIWHEVKFLAFFLFSCFEWVIKRSTLLPWGAGMFVMGHGSLNGVLYCHAMGCGYVCHGAWVIKRSTLLPWGAGMFVLGQEKDVCLLFGGCFVCYEVKRVWIKLMFLSEVVAWGKISCFFPVFLLWMRHEICSILWHRLFFPQNIFLFTAVSSC